MTIPSELADALRAMSPAELVEWIAPGTICAPWQEEMLEQILGCVHIVKP